MPIIEAEKWKKCQEMNDDPYGGACVDVARKVMEILDAEPGDFDTHKIICQANEGSGSITGFMAGAVASMVSELHSRGDEFRRKWNVDNQINEGEGEKVNDEGE